MVGQRLGLRSLESSFLRRSGPDEEEEEEEAADRVRRDVLKGVVGNRFLPGDGLREVPIP